MARFEGTRAARFGALALLASAGWAWPAGGALAAAPSFDCGADTLMTERAICASDELAALDRDLNRVYVGAMTALGGPDKAALRGEQHAWIKRRNTCLADETCIADYYRDRIAYLERIREPTRSVPTPRRGAPGGPQPAVAVPAAATSLGGTVRNVPGGGGIPLAVLKVGETITIMRTTDQTVAGHGWFFVRYEGGEGYMWGGDLCTAEAGMPGVRKTCPQ